MFVKRVTIEGFKSYKDQVVIDLKPQLNVIVGYNGTGKSNFFSAIDFVLSGDSYYARQKTRASLLHEGCGPKVHTAFVEIAFYNSNRIIPINSDEVLLRRVISLKKDKYYLNKKCITKKDVLKLFEYAGFIAHNPYYIVKQGKVNELGSASASQNLQCIKQVARVGTSDSQCQKMLERLKEILPAKLDQLDRGGGTVRELKETLELFSRELVEFQRLDRGKRALIYVLTDRQLKTEKKNLADVQENFESTGELEDVERFNKTKSKTSQVASQLYEIQKLINIAQEREAVVRIQVGELELETERLSKNIEELKATSEGRNEEKQYIQRKCEEAAVVLAEAQSQLEAILPACDELTRKKDDLSRKIDRLKEKLDSLSAQHARNFQFSSKEERDNAIRKEMSSLNQKIRSVKELVDESMKNIEELEQAEESLQKDAKEHYEKMVVVKEMENNLAVLRRDEKQLRLEKTELFNKRMEKEQELSALRKQYEVDGNRLRSMASTAVLNGLESVQEVLKRFRQGDDAQWQIVDQYYGLVVDNFNCIEAVKTAVEVTAGGSLFHHVVARDEVAKEILKAMHQRNLQGEVTFLPLGSLRVRPITCPKAERAVPLIAKLNFEERFSKVYQKLFGSTLLCETVEIAIDLSGRYRIDCVTFDGDQASKQGWLMGGYVNPLRSRFKLYEARKALLKQVEEMQAEIERLQEELDQAEKAHNEVVSNVEKQTLKIEVLRRDSRKLGNSFVNETDTNRLLHEKQQSMENMALLEKMVHRFKELEKELEQELPKREAFDQEMYKSLNLSLLQLEQQRAEVLAELQGVQAKKHNLEETIKHSPFNLLKKALQELDLDDNETQVYQCDQELNMSKSNVISTRKVLLEIQATLEKLGREEKQKKAEHDKLKAEKNAARLQMEKNLSQTRFLFAKIAECEEKVQVLEKKIEGLGPVSGEIEAFLSWNTRKLVDELDRVEKRFKEYEGIDMVTVASLAVLLKRVEETLCLPPKLRRHIRLVLETVEYFMERQSEIIRLTFQKVRRNFRQTFKALVPGGRGDLTLVEKALSPTSASCHSDEVEDLPTLDGVLVQVSFAEGKPMQDMRHLSAGQRSVVALSLIFALQQCNPSPFYIFDEVDHTLDLQHRSALSLVINELKSRSQFLVSTFKPELLQHAEQYVGVNYHNKQTRVGPLSKEAALQIIQNQQQDEN